MSQFVNGPAKGLITNMDIPDGAIVKITTSVDGRKRATLATAATDMSVGVLDGGGGLAPSGKQATIRLRTAEGTSQVKLGGTVALNDPLTANASGLAVTATVAGQQIVGYALEAGVANDMIEMLPSTGKF